MVHPLPGSVLTTSKGTTFLVGRIRTLRNLQAGSLARPEASDLTEIDKRIKMQHDTMCMKLE